MVMRRQTLTIILGGFSFAQLFYLPPVEPGVYFHALKAPKESEGGDKLRPLKGFMIALLHCCESDVFVDRVRNVDERQIALDVGYV